MKKIALIFLCFALLLSTACSRVIENESFETEGYILINDEEVVPEYMMKIGDNNISFAEFRYYYLNQKFELDGGNQNVWTDYPEYIEILKKYVEDILIEIYSIRSLAAENNIMPDYEKVSDEIKQYKKQMSSSEYKEGLASYYLTSELQEYILQGYELYDALFEYYFGDNGVRTMTNEEIEKYCNKNYMHAKHILINPNTTMSDEDYDAYLQEILNKAQNGADFDELIKEYSDDDQMPEYGFYFKDENMPSEFVTACADLDEGEVSELVKSSYGYHIIKRLPVDLADISALKDIIYNDIYDEIIYNKIDNIEIEYAPEYEYVSPFSIK